MNHVIALATLFAAYPNTQVDDTTSEVYLRLLKDIHPIELQQVIDQAIATCKFMPTIAEIRDMRNKLVQVEQTNYVEGWTEVQRAIRYVGVYETPIFVDPITARVVESMGWRNLCMSENAMADRAQFERMYKELAGKQQEQQKLLPHVRQYIEANGGKSVAQLVDMARQRLQG
jgi:hypothetical protein